MKNIVIVGATSAIAHSTARLFAEKKANFFLIARNEEKLNTVADDLKARGASEISSFVLDINDLEGQKLAIEQAISALGSLDLLLVAHGTLPDQERCNSDTIYLLEEFHTNATSTMSFLQQISTHFEQQNKGSIAVITSVAGDRGRQSNYLYGAAKATISTYLSGLRNRLSKSNVQVLDIKPGFVDTPMTSDIKKGALWAQPEDIARGIEKALLKGSDVVYLPFFWRYIMLIIKNIPEFIFKKLSL